MTFTALRSTRDLREAARELGEDTGEITEWIARLEEGAARLWNPGIGAYDALNLRTGNFAGSVSNASFLCWWAGLKDARALPTFRRVMGARASASRARISTRRASIRCATGGGRSGR
jgi:hypothetical protein